MLRRSARLQGKRKADTQPNLGISDTTNLPHRRIKCSGSVQDAGTSLGRQKVDEPPPSDSDIEILYSSRKKKTVSGVSLEKKATEIIVNDKKPEKVQRKLGLLHIDATEIPMDIIFEIFAHLGTPDILQLSFTSRDLRNILTAPSSEYVWRNARLNVEGLPPLPPGLSEIQYANLMFDTTCEVCEHWSRGL
ncbi:hypothetical protein K435DRAFT_844588 [Dendrothele bispora CBS 962.96]|uniref:F-box domain-containing protein n=1 Tax=Dendrothele bispora (strain CBS 962.96) TaxID=1314807 RepID=A0A4S8L0T7_DENBC|nr:hypothetical protein K435DRAFT_844588 [Dendrothele bispora CBS 962.96]